MSTMRVTITDKEALRALSWKAVKAYLEASDWHRAKVIPQKGVIYQHTDRDGRLWEIAVLTRDDLADYVSRMADAVTILARVEDRSELDVYDDLRALGTRMKSRAPEGAEPSTPVVDDAARAVHERIRKWLAEEGWQIEEVVHPEANFNIVVTLQNGILIHLFQRKDHLDHITFSRHWLYDEVFRSAIERLSKDEQRDLVWTVFRDISVMGVDFAGHDTPTTEMTLRTYLYFDALTKDALIQRIRLMIRAIELAVRTVARVLEMHHHSDENFVSHEDLSRIVRLGPQTYGPLTVAS